MLPLMEELNPLKMTNGALGNVARADIWPMANMGSNRSLDESDASMRQRLVNSLSQSFPGSALSRALNYMDSDSEDMKTDPLSNSCFTELRLDKGPMDEDDELTSLAWLQDTNLIKNINAGEVDDQLTDEDGQKENGDIQAVVPASTPIHPPHVPYNPQKHINNKPPYSFSCLIFMAIEESPQKSLPVKDIYSWILKNFPYFLSAPTGWKNSVRHNLSLNKCFKKVEKEKGQSIGKGSLWCIDPDYRPNLLQALRKTPYHPYHQLQMLAGNQTAQANSNSNQYNVKPVPLAPKFSPNSLSLSHLFPFLSKRLAQSGCDTDSDIHDVAYTLMSMKGLNKQNSRRSGDVENSGENNTRLKLKRKQRGAPYGPVRKKQAGPIVCTSSPSEDHNYSATSTQATDDDSYDVSSSSIDDEYDFGPEPDEGEDDEDAYSDFDSYHSDFDEEESFSEEDTGNRPHQANGSQQAVSSNASVITSVVSMTTASPSIDSATKTVTKEGFPFVPQSGKNANEARDKFINRQHRSKKRLPILDEDEKKKIAEGADALLNLAGIKTTQITKTSTTAAVAVVATTATTNTSLSLTPTPAIEAPTFTVIGSQDSTLLNGSETWTEELICG
ncbi:forkhead box protein N3-like [Octopus vulgaris]|uniref:Forkhead box protein N3 n=1 Tax=Octopus vulgaris TaxID=6645 RepID=A0AA36AN61_OCTVU|nr:forkhead box protein N3-like [Octopus vulgaris]